MSEFTESVVEDAALAWSESLGCAVKRGPEIALGKLTAERVESGTLEILPDAILPKLLPGEIWVKVLERSLERTV